jgi:hypothetical protein
VNALETARRLEALGVVVRSAELADEAKRQQEFQQNGNRAMRRAAARAKRRRGRS